PIRLRRRALPGTRIARRLRYRISVLDHLVHGGAERPLEVLGALPANGLELLSLPGREDLRDAVPPLLDHREDARPHLPPDRLGLAVGLGEDGFELALLVGGEVEPSRQLGRHDPMPHAEVTDRTALGARAGRQAPGVVAAHQLGAEHADDHADQEQRHHAGQGRGTLHRPLTTLIPRETGRTRRAAARSWAARRAAATAAGRTAPAPTAPARPRPAPPPA